MVGSAHLRGLPRRQSGLLDDTEYDYAAQVYPQQQVLYWVPPPLEEEKDEDEEAEDASALSVEEYQSPDLSKEEAL
jgi:hypothetical protein